MLSLTQASRLKGNAGKRLPDVWTGLDQQKIHFRRGQLHLIVAAPGVGKSVLTMSYAIQAKVPTLYLSMDTDPFTTCVRVVSAVTLVDLAQAEEGLQKNLDFATQALKTASNLKFSFPASPELADLFSHVYAYGEAEGQWPELIVIDNLSNIAFEGDEFGGMRTIMADLQTMASRTKAAVLVLHHSIGQYEDGQTIIPQSGVNGKVAKFPSMVLTMCRGTTGDQLFVSSVKNRFGPADPSGFKVRAQLAVDYSRMQVRDAYVISESRAA